MANDFKRKEPTKTEKVLYEIMVAHQNMERGLWSTSSVVMALAMITKTDPKQIAEALVEEEKIKDFSKKVNEEIKKLEEAKHKDHKHDEIMELKGDSVDEAAK